MGDLEINCDLERERHQWRAERIGWCIMLLIALAAFFGPFGGSPLSKGRASNSALTVEYERISRYQAPGELRIRGTPRESNEFRLQIDQQYLDHLEITSFSPEPAETKLEGDKHEFVFPAEGRSEQAVTIRYEGAKFGRTGGTIAVKGSPGVEIKQFFWP